jgi:hypothetical protein
VTKEPNTMLDDTSLAYLTAVTNNQHNQAAHLGLLLDVATQLEQQAAVDLGHAALDYARQGVAVFPLKPAGKTPLTAHGFKDATTDPRRISEWWQAQPDANIGLPTGITFDVIDIDGHDGIVTMYSGTNPIIDTVVSIGTARTSRDGGRHIYVPATGRGNKASIYPGVDYRGTGGYVVAPPSVGANGVRYQWADQLTNAQAAAA